MGPVHIGIIFPNHWQPIESDICIPRYQRPSKESRKMLAFVNNDRLGPDSLMLRAVNQVRDKL